MNARTPLRDPLPLRPLVFDPDERESIVAEARSTPAKLLVKITLEIERQRMTLSDQYCYGASKLPLPELVSLIGQCEARVNRSLLVRRAQLGTLPRTSVPVELKPPS